MTNHPINMLKKHLDKLNIEYEYNKHRQSLVISFAEKKIDSIHNVNYKAIEIEYHTQNKQFHLEIYTYFNRKDYHQLPNFNVMCTDFPDDNIHCQLVAITIKHYIQASETELTIVDMLQNTQ